MLDFRAMFCPSQCSSPLDSEVRMNEIRPNITTEFRRAHLLFVSFRCLNGLSGTDGCGYLSRRTVTAKRVMNDVLSIFRLPPVRFPRKTFCFYLNCRISIVANVSETQRHSPPTVIIRKPSKHTGRLNASKKHLSVPCSPKLLRQNTIDLSEKNHLECSRPSQTIYTSL